MRWGFSLPGSRVLLKQTLHGLKPSPSCDSVCLLIEVDAVAVLSLFAKHVENLEIKVVFNVSSKPGVIILWPLLFLRFFCLLGSPSRPGP